MKSIKVPELRRWNAWLGEAERSEIPRPSPAILHSEHEKKLIARKSA
jgi:hypothetical protein